MKLRLCFLNFFLVSPFAHGFTVVIDPGHGGMDVGASRGLFLESKIVFEIAQKIKEKLSDKTDIEIYLTRTEQKGKSLENRVLFAQEKKADLFLSLHANSSTSTQANGMEYYFSAKQPGNVLGRVFLKSSSGAPTHGIVNSITRDLIDFGKMKHSLEFSKKIKTAAQLFLNADDFGKHRTSANKIRRAPFYVIENTNMPAVLVEVGFISNQREARKLTSPEYQAKLARALSDAIQNYKEDIQRKE